MILRASVLAIAGAAAAVGAAALIFGLFSPAIIFGFWGALIVIGTVYERVRYKAVLKRPPGSGWQRTPERFLDPETSQPVTVYIDPATGERQYVQE